MMQFQIKYSICSLEAHTLGNYTLIALLVVSVLVDAAMEPQRQLSKSEKSEEVSSAVVGWRISSFLR